mmetsp:Transcript_25372/g.28144  ORF Transcript_25372/g.28144 Transcript_25372/m.28144 type:complete len:450 (+) Transcript_25372:37-1386(+)|eukprot:CAMPEP_0205824038 /NCGR_PEP_ID=MMETSP0206-20130828/19135_1 /ASSEMBLY_ACC=CAM_ASM_000279 /TAXON_ID=36767 /ORGANISM="Euplotes focardii, Strain TN1" /LENGTH=449 /DNA_ID=CAMNT_0053121781 /DNA_START=33 /DNA_END=1382 /DNA_ORIENTATION=+
MAEEKAPQTPLEELRSQFRGAIITPQDAEYDTARLMWNRCIEAKPDLIVHPQSINDVQVAVKHAVKHKTGLSVSGGGHGFNSKLDGTMCIDLAANLNQVVVDAANKTVWVQGGARGIDLDHGLGSYGLATPSGTNNDTGVGGLALGGGIGWLSRKWGLMVDNMLEVHLVTAKGDLLVVNAETEPDLFWGMRGGGTHFGVAVAIKLQAYDLKGMAQGGPMVHPFPNAVAAVTKALQTAATFGDEHACWAAWAHGPDGNPCAMTLPFAAEPGAAADAAFAPLMTDPAPVAVMNGPMPYTAVNGMLNHVQRTGLWYERAMFYEDAPSPEVIKCLHEAFAAVPAKKTSIIIGQMGGKISSVGAEDTVFAARKCQWWVVLLCNFEADEAEATTKWCNELYTACTALQPSNGAYANAVSDSNYCDPYQVNKARLTALKKEWDPEHLFPGAKRINS